ncbi:MAG: acetate kinase [Paludibacteraceae bacterium]|nr:acetate kinase [Paludibacteraceae bacterium]MBR4840278.1 acetate kinase [Paludibacteraceae bacterium]
MKILVLNCGSSSIKYKLIEMPANNVLAQGGVEKVGLKDSFLKLTLPNGEKEVLEKEIPEHTVGIEFILETLTSKERGAIKSLDEIDAVGHRVVHGGEKFNKSVLITDEVIKNIEECIKVAPLHNPPNLKGIAAVTKLMPGKPQVAVFDTAFHQTMPQKAFMYALPYELYQKDGVRKYGFHGTSHRYVSQRALEILGKKAEGTKMITCHIGNGGSITAIKDGKSIDTTMGMTPLEGLVMGTRAGDIDAGAVTYLMESKQYDAKTISNILNKKSGLLGVSGVSSDMRDVRAAIASGNEQAKLALDMFIYRAKKYIGSFVAALGGVDIIVFTGGIGENVDVVRESICDNMECFGVKIDKAVNATVHGEEKVISTKDSKATVIVVPTDEEYMIASDTLAIVSKK